MVPETALAATTRTSMPVLSANFGSRWPKRPEFSVEVVDDGAGGASWTGGSGRGLAGMRERAELLGGRFDAGPVVGGGFRVTADIPLAAEVIDKGGKALNPRGELYTRDNIRQRLSMRDFLETLRGSGIDTGGPSAFSHADRQAFANQLDRLLSH